MQGCEVKLQKLSVAMLQAYKVEREGGEAVSRLLPPGPGHLEAFSPGRQHSSAGSCGTPDPRTPVTPRPASQQTERWVSLIPGRGARGLFYVYKHPPLPGLDRG